MPFQEVPSKVDFVAQEEQILDLWRRSGAFQKLRDLRQGAPKWSFIDGPITANNPMAVHHAWGRTYKDLYHRYWAMRGRETRYQNGFDCQGLWVEVEVERELGFTSKKDIEAYGLADFVRRCKQRVLRYAAVQTEQSVRLGYWMDWNDPDHLRALAEQLEADPSQVITVQGVSGPVTDTVEGIVGRLGMPELGGSYFTFSNENNYMIWTFLKECWQKGWLYRGADVMPWCPRCATGLSQHEIVTDGYDELTHPSVTLRFPLRGREGESLLVWTTTPWTLTSNVAAAVGKDLTYLKVRNQGQVLYLSKGTTHMLQGPYEVLAELKGAEMEGWAYDGPFDDLPAEQQPGGHASVREMERTSGLSAAQAHRVILWDAVGEAEGTGIVHIAPGCGAEDFRLGKEYGLPLVAPLDEEGVFVDGFGWLTGRHVEDVRQPIFDALRDKGLLYHVADYTHRYPICWRCKTELVFRLVDEWFIRMDELRHDMMNVTRQIRWIPSFGLERELDWLSNMDDWMISKKRYWGLALPFWTCDACQHYEVIGDEQELQSRAVAGWPAFYGHSPHRPYIDEVKIACPKCGALMSRVPDVGNPWLDAGIVPFSTLSYRKDREYWAKWFPADWISESFPGQFRNWFYSLLAMSTVLVNRPPFLQNFGYATVYGEDGRPMHKSAGNAIDFNDAARSMGVDVMRWMYCAQKPENNLLFGYTRADEVRRQFLIPLWNVYSFFASYARLDDWTPSDPFDPDHPEGATPRSENILDRWILARLNEVTGLVTRALEDSDAYGATIALEAFLDDLTNWYVRRSRRRFWKSEHDADKNAAYATLYHVLVKFAGLLAPFTPFVTEEMYQNLVRGPRPTAHDSVHHCRWPCPDAAALDDSITAQMTIARTVASLGLGARSTANVKVRQPLAKAYVYAGGWSGILNDEIGDIIKDELNVKELEFVEREDALVRYRLTADGRKLGPRLGPLFPKVRAALAELDVPTVVRATRAGGSVALAVEGQEVTLAPEEIIVHTESPEGLAVASDRGIVVAIDATITPALRDEGLVRDLVRYVQTLRKDVNYALDQRITVGLFGLSDAACEAVERYRGYLMAETLATSVLLDDDGAPWDGRTEERLAGQAVEIAVRAAPNNR